MASNYAYAKYDEKKMARARLQSQGISTKDSVEIAKAIRGRSLVKSIDLMNKVIQKQQPIKYTRFNAESAAHKPGIGPGRYPVSAATVYLQMLESVKANAEQKDLDSDSLKIVHIKADKASRPFHFSRHRGRKMKRTHLEIVVAEDDAIKAKSAKKLQKKKSPSKKTASKSDAVKKTEEKPKAAEAKPQDKAEEKEEVKEEVKAEEKEEKTGNEKSESKESHEKPKVEEKEAKKDEEKKE